MISTLQFEALDGSYLQVSVQRADVRVTAYRFESLCIDTRICPVEPSFPRQVVFSQILEGGVAWLGPSPWEENDSLGSVAPSNLYFGNDAPWKRRTLESTLGISLWVPAEASRPFEEPGPLPNIGIPAVRDLAFHLLEK